MDTILSFCAIYVVFMVLFVVNDIIKSAISQFKGTNYQWYTIKVLKEKREWWKWALGIGAFVAGVYCMLTIGAAVEPAEDRVEDATLPRSELINCSYCGEDFPEKYQFETYAGDPICPNCIRDDFNVLVSGEILRCVICDSFYFPEDSNGYGLCWDCSLEYLTGCSFCGQYTFIWYNEDGFSLCPECAGNLYSDEKIQQAIETWIEG